MLVRLKDALGVVTDAELAERLGMKRNALYNRKAAKSPPYAAIVAICEQEQISLDWIILGRGPLAETVGRSVTEVAKAALFPPAEQIITASDDAARAAILLRLPDAIAFSHSEVLSDACIEAGFTDGLIFISFRAAAFSATRRIDGRLPVNVAASLDSARAALIALIADPKVSSPTGRTRHAKSAARPAASFSGGGMTDRFPARAPERDTNPGGFPVEMTEIGPQYVIPGCERPATPKSNDGAAHD